MMIILMRKRGCYETLYRTLSDYETTPMVANGFLFRGGTAKRFPSSKTQQLQQPTSNIYLFLTFLKQLFPNESPLGRLMQNKKLFYFNVICVSLFFVL